MDTSKYLKGSYITAKDLGDEVRNEIIANAQEGKYDKLDLVFQSGDKLGSLSDKNLRTLHKHYGKESDDWIGLEIQLVVGELIYEDKPVPAVLITPVSPDIAREKRKHTAINKPEANGGAVDEIPF